MPLSKPQKEAWTKLAYFRSSRKDMCRLRPSWSVPGLFLKLFFKLLIRSTLLCTASAMLLLRITGNLITKFGTVYSDMTYYQIRETHAHKHTHTNTLTHTQTRTHKHTLTNTRTQTHTRKHVHTNTRTQTHANTWTQTHEHKHTHTNTCTQTQIHRRRDDFIAFFA